MLKCSDIKIFLNLIKANFKRLTKYLPSLFIAILLILVFLSSAGIYISRHIYKSNKYETAKIAYFLDSDGDERYINFAIDYLKSMDSMRETSSIIEVHSVEEGYALLDKKEAMFFIYLPSGFYEGIMTGHNPTVNLVVSDASNISAYVTNELFLSLSKYLAVAQAAIYSAIDTSWIHSMDDDELSRISNLSNKIFLQKVLDKDSVINIVEATAENSYPLKKHYESAAIMLSLLFMAFILIPYMQGMNIGTRSKLSSYKINTFHIFSCNLLCIITAVYLTYIPCYLTMLIIHKKVNPSGIITVIPSILLIALIITIIGSLSKSAFSGNMILLFFVIAIAYVGGAIIPNAMLPHVIQSISPYMPGKYMINNIAYSLFG